jgi:hypothetical protein
MPSTGPTSGLAVIKTEGELGLKCDACGTLTRIQDRVLLFYAIILQIYCQFVMLFKITYHIAVTIQSKRV